MSRVLARRRFGNAQSAMAKTRYPVSDHCDGHVFRNADPNVRVVKSLADVLKWKFACGQKSWPTRVQDNQTPQLTHRLNAGDAAFTFINHATELIQLPDLTFITDPLFSERTSPISWIGPKRARIPGARLEELPRIDVVLLSHNHYDHLDIASMTSLLQRDDPLVITPLGNKGLLTKIGFKKVTELDWWESTTLKTGVRVTVVPMQHWSARGLNDRCKALWGGMVVESTDLKFLFAGDTGYSAQFRQIFDKFGAMDASLLPIGAYEPRWFMKDQHMNPADAVRAHLDLASRLSLGIHFGTFQLTDEGIEDPVIGLTQSLAAAGVSAADFIAPKNGQTTLYRKSTQV